MDCWTSSNSCKGLALPASVWEDEILPRRVVGYRPADLDELCVAGEVVWRGFESLGADDGRFAFYLTDQLAALAPEPREADHELAGARRRVDCPAWRPVL